MRGFGIIFGYIIGNKDTRDWLVHKICQASCLIDKEIKKSSLGKLFIKENNNDK